MAGPSPRMKNYLPIGIITLSAGQLDLPLFSPVLFAQGSNRIKKVTVGKSIMYTIFALTNQNMQSVKTCVLVISFEIRNKPDGIVKTQL